MRSDPIGLLRREHAFDDVHQLYVHPRTTALPSTSAGLIRDLEGSPTRRLVDSDMSFHAIREYTAGDSRRQIHWKSTAKTGRLMVRQYEESRRSRMAIVLAVAEGEYADADEFELAVACAASLGLRAVHDARDIIIVTGSEIPRVVRGRLRAISHLPAAAPRPMLDAFSGMNRLENTMPVAEVCRLTAESGDRLSIAFVVVGSRVPLGRLQQAALAFPADTAVVAVICDERAHPRMQQLSSLTVLTVGTLDDLSGLLLQRCDGMSGRDAGIRRERGPVVVPRVVVGSVLRGRRRRHRGRRGLADLPLVGFRAARARRHGGRRRDRHRGVAPHAGAAGGSPQRSPAPSSCSVCRSRCRRGSARPPTSSGVWASSRWGRSSPGRTS